MKKLMTIGLVVIIPHLCAMEEKNPEISKKIEATKGEFEVDNKSTKTSQGHIYGQTLECPVTNFEFNRMDPEIKKRKEKILQNLTEKKLYTNLFAMATMTYENAIAEHNINKSKDIKTILTKHAEEIEKDIFQGMISVEATMKSLYPEEGDLFGKELQSSALSKLPKLIQDQRLNIHNRLTLLLALTLEEHAILDEFDEQVQNKKEAMS